MRIFIRAIKDNFPETEIEYAAFQGFSALGFKPVFFTNESELDECRPDDLIVGGVSTITRKMESYGIPLTEYDYPESLRWFFGRKIWRDNLESVLSEKEKWPVFVKPIRDKAFIGFVLNKESDVPRLYRAKSDEPVYCSELVDFDAEWRVFVRYGNVIDVRPYKGDWKKQYDHELIEQAVMDFYYDAPAGYSMDIGVTSKGETLLVEVNDGFALGTYGLDPIQYAKLLSARWCELVGIYDECDQYHESVDWKKEKARLEQQND